MANSYSTVPGLNHLNNYMKDDPSGIIVEGEFIWHSLLDALRQRVDSKDFQGNVTEIDIQTDYDFSGQAMGERVTFPYSGNPAFVKMRIPLKEVVVPAGITQQALDRATGGEASWGKIVDREVAQTRNMKFPWLMELCAMGDGTGRLARVVSAAEGSDTVVVTCDNTYIDWGWENVRFIRKGMWVEFYDTAGAIISDNSVTSWKVTATSFGDRANSTATTGTFTIETAAGRDDDITTLLNVDNVVVYLANSRSISSSTSDDVSGTARYEATNMQSTVDVTTSLPMGLTGIYQTTNASYDYSDGTVDCTLDTFQGLTRSSYDTLDAHFYNGVTITGGSGTAGTPGDWDLSAITDAWNEVYEDTQGEIDMLICSSQLSTCMDRKNPITITTDTAEKAHQNLAGPQYAKPFRAPNGQLIPVVVSRSIPKNVLYGITTSDLHWYVKGGFGFRQYGSGDIWILSPGNRYALYEAWYGGYTQLACERADRAFVIQDLLDNVS